MAGCRERSRVYDDQGAKLLRRGGDTYEASWVLFAILFGWNADASPDLGMFFRLYTQAITPRFKSLCTAVASAGANYDGLSY